MEAVCTYVGRKLGLETRFIVDIDWQARERLLDADQIEVAWICGWPYVLRADRPGSGLELLVAPLMSGARYRGRPVYYSDVIVRRQSPFQAFGDLRGARWAYNEPGSQSGYNITRYTLAQLGAFEGFFSSAVAAGSHQRSIEMVLDGGVDAAAIDSTVLELEQERDGRIATDLRVIASLGPSPIPPFVISRRVDPGLRAALRAVLSEMHLDAAGRQVLERGKIRQLIVVADRAYDIIRQMARAAERVRL